MTTLALIYARSRNYCIGKNGGLPWDLPDEYAFFERTTIGHPVIMGRRSYEDHEAALPQRLNVVVSRSRQDFDAGVLLAPNLNAAVDIAARHDELVFVIGGAGLLEAAFERASVVFESVIDADIEGDVFVSTFDFSGWRCTELLHHEADERHAFAFRTCRYERP